MRFDAYAALAKLRGAGGDAATCATCATPPPETRPYVAQVAQVAQVARRTVQIAEIPRAEPTSWPAALPPAQRPADGGDTFPHGVCRFTGRPRTWTGKVVALDDWRRLSDWEREGPAGRLFCGLCRAWVAQGGGCAEPGCWKGGEQ